MLYRFHVRIAAADSSRPLVTFDDALSCLSRLPQMFAEPDGSFVWASPAVISPRWQVDGNLVDGGERLYYVELKGTCPPATFDELLSCFAPVRTALTFELAAEGRLLDERAFRELALNCGRD